jgi:aspartyl protease family protein
VNPQLTRRAVFAASLGAAGSLVLPNRAAAVTYEVKAGNDGHFIVRALIDNTEVDALIDTGASAVAIPAEDAGHIGLRVRSSDFTVPVSTANGAVNAARASLRRVDIGNVRVRDVEALVMPEGVLGITLIGMTFLGRLKGFKVDGGVLVLDN